MTLIKKLLKRTASASFLLVAGFCFILLIGECNMAFKQELLLKGGAAIIGLISFIIGLSIDSERLLVEDDDDWED